MMATTTSSVSSMRRVPPPIPPRGVADHFFPDFVVDHICGFAGELVDAQRASWARWAERSELAHGEEDYDEGEGEGEGEGKGDGLAFGTVDVFHRWGYIVRAWHSIRPPTKCGTAAAAVAASKEKLACFRLTGFSGVDYGPGVGC